MCTHTYCCVHIKHAALDVQFTLYVTCYVCTYVHLDDGRVCIHVTAPHAADGCGQSRVRPTAQALLFQHDYTIQAHTPRPRSRRPPKAPSSRFDLLENPNPRTPPRPAPTLPPRFQSPPPVPATQSGSRRLNVLLPRSPYTQPCKPNKQKLIANLRLFLPHDRPLSASQLRSCVGRQLACVPAKAPGQSPTTRPWPRPASCGLVRPRALKYQPRIRSPGRPFLSRISVQLQPGANQPPDGHTVNVRASRQLLPVRE